MQESSNLAPPTSFFPLWGRVAFAWFMFALSALGMWSSFFRFDWVPFSCMGLLSLFLVLRPKGESRRAYFSKPRTIISSALVITIIATSLRALYYDFTK
jgi:hypothetical protein